MSAVSAVSAVTAALPPFQALYAPPDEELAAQFLSDAAEDPAAKQRIDARSRLLIGAIRAKIGGLGGVEDFLHAFSLSTKEGLALMVLAEALLRVPDAATADRLIEDKLAAGRWLDGDVKSTALLVSASAWTLGIAARVIHPAETPETILDNIVRRIGLPAMRSDAPGNAASRITFCHWPHHRGGAAPRQSARGVFLFLRHARRGRAHARRCRELFWSLCRRHRRHWRPCRE